jgi:hypothetical protein
MGISNDPYRDGQHTRCMHMILRPRSALYELFTVSSDATHYYSCPVTVWIAFSYSWRCLKHAGRNFCGSLFPFDHSSLSSSFFTGAQPRHDGPPKSFILDVDLRSASHRVSKLHSLAIFEVGIGVIEEFWSHDSSSTLWPSMLSIIILFCTRLCHLDLPSTTPQPSAKSF